MAVFTKTVVVLAAALVYNYINLNNDNDEVIVETSYGKLRGFKSLSRQGNDIYNFRAIPYAKPPVGELRFQPPDAIGKWEGILDATRSVPICLQVHPLFKKIVGEEDCLYLNVYIRQNPTQVKKEKRRLQNVMVFIHGGHFQFGGSDLFQPQYLLDEHVVLVTLNYRVGALGFMNNGFSALGNMGLKDQLMALKWVKANIEHFGGDPKSITLFGNSAGGASVHFLMISPQSQGLFHRAISQSGSALCPWVIGNVHLKDAQAQVHRLGTKLFCPADDDVEKVFKCINSTAGNVIVETQTEIYNTFHSPEAIYGPSFEVPSEDAFLTEDVYNSYLSGKSGMKISWLTGISSHDGCYRTGAFINDEDKMEYISKHWESVAPNALMYNKNDDTSSAIFQYYFGSIKRPFDKDDYSALTNMFSDRYFFGCASDAAQIQANHSDVYLYYMNYKGDMSVGEILAAAPGKYPIMLELLYAMLKKLVYKNIFRWDMFDYGFCHADELRYIFYTSPLFDMARTSPEYTFSKSLIRRWVAFAKTGIPSDVELGDVEWEKVVKGKVPRYFVLDGSQGEMIDEPFSSRLKFWKTLILY